jgi:hypothetical protein
MTKMTKDELKALLRSLERKGMIESLVNASLRSLERKGLMESFIDADGEVYWRRTAKGNAVADGEADWPKGSRYGLDS